MTYSEPKIVVVVNKDIDQQTRTRVQAMVSTATTYGLTDVLVTSETDYYVAPGQVLILTVDFEYDEYETVRIEKYVQKTTGLVVSDIRQK